MTPRAWLWGAVAAALLAALGLHLERLDSGRIAVPAMETEEVAALCARTGYSIDAFWERAQALGVQAGVIREKSLDQAIARGEILRFSSEEIAKWKAVGLVAPGVDLKPNALWTKDARSLDLVLQAVARQGVEVTTTVLGGFFVVQLPESVGPLYLQSFDPETLRRLQERAVAPILAEGGRRGPVYLYWKGQGWEGQTQAAEASPDLTLDRADWSVDGSPGALSRSLFSQPRRLIVLGLSPEKGLETNFALLRSALKPLAVSGDALGLPARPPTREPVAAPRRALALLVLWLGGVLGPLFAARGGLVALRLARGWALQNRPEASPVLQLLVGLLACAAASVSVGLCARGALVWGGDDLVSGSWLFWTKAGPVVAALLTLYTVDLASWGRRLAAAVTWAKLLRLAAIAAAAALLLEPRRAMPGSALWGEAAGWADAAGLWWLPWRWREIVVGIPCLIQAMYLINRRLDCPDCESTKTQILRDPRGWFVLGLLGPVGAILSIGAGAFPLKLALAQTAGSVLAGGAIGAGLVGARLWALSRAKDPDVNRSIVPEKQV